MLRKLRTTILFILFSSPLLLGCATNVKVISKQVQQVPIKRVRVQTFSTIHTSAKRDKTHFILRFHKIYNCHTRYTIALKEYRITRIMVKNAHFDYAIGLFYIGTGLSAPLMGLLFAPSTDIFLGTLVGGMGAIVKGTPFLINAIVKSRRARTSRKLVMTEYINRARFHRQRCKAIPITNKRIILHYKGMEFFQGITSRKGEVSLPIQGFSFAILPNVKHISISFSGYSTTLSKMLNHPK